MSIVERYHTEDKAHRDAHAGLHREIDQAVGFLVNKDETNDQRLNAGAATMAALSQQIVDTNRRFTWTPAKIFTAFAAVVLPAFIYVTTLVWQAAKYPTRDECKDLERQVQSLTLAIDRVGCRLDPNCAAPPTVTPLRSP